MPAAKALSPKVIVTNRGALAAKYGAAGVARIETALRKLEKADAKRGFGTRVVYVDRASSKWPRVNDAEDPKENKTSIDGVVKALRPEYLMLLGSVDVIPYQDLRNPLYDPVDDDDQFALGDLPYACEAPYSRTISDFLGPTRVVGRLPDLTGASDPAYLIDLLARAASAKPSPPPGGAFALSVKLWEQSTRKSIRILLGTTPQVLTSPAKGPKHPPAALGAQAHFVNCHGADEDGRFFGEGPAGTFPDALDSRKLQGLKRGSVAAFECCYGAQLYDPALAGGVMSISNAYLAAGFYGVVASSNIAYGPPDDVANADVICRVFLENLLEGASLGRAFAEARLTLVAKQSVVDPYNSKTLAQFVLLGDPSIHPFAAAAAAPKSRLAKDIATAERAQRRVRIMKAGSRLGETSAFTVPLRKSDAHTKRLKAELRKRVKGSPSIRTFVVRDPARSPALAGLAKRKGVSSGQRVLVAMRNQAKESDRVVRLVAVLAYEVDGRLVTKQLVSR